MGVITRTCAWLADGPLSRQQLWCPQNFHSHVTVGQKCAITCFEATPRNCNNGFTNFPSDWTDEYGSGCDFYAQGDNCAIWGGGDAGPSGLTGNKHVAFVVVDVKT